MTFPSGAGIREIHDAFDARKFTPVEFLREHLNRARASQRNDFITVCEERALGQAREAESIIAREGRVPRDRFPLLGVPLGVKDALCIDGVRTTCASRMLENYVAPYTATSVARLEAAGAITVGKLNMDEFAMGGSNENSAFGPVKHPTFPDRVPGGSSGGSAAAVAGGACTVSLGSDTGGSIRLPASYCGIVGVKPTYGRVSRFGLVAFASSLDQVGPMARSVEDAAVVLDVMSGHDPRDSTSAPCVATTSASGLAVATDLTRVRIGVPREYFGDGLAPRVRSALEESLKWFEKQGAKLVDIELPRARYAVSVYYIVAVSEASSNLERFDGVRYGTRSLEAQAAQGIEAFYNQVRAKFGPEVKRRIILGTFALSAGYSDAYYRRACQVRRLIQQDFDEAFSKVDLIAGPVSPTPAFKLGEKSLSPLEMYLNDVFTIPANLAGIPALSVPCGEDAQGLPIGLQLQAPSFEENRLISVAHAYETGRA